MSFMIVSCEVLWEVRKGFRAIADMTWSSPAPLTIYLSWPHLWHLIGKCLWLRALLSGTSGIHSGHLSAPHFPELPVSSSFLPLHGVPLPVHLPSSSLGIAMSPGLAHLHPPCPPAGYMWHSWNRREIRRPMFPSPILTALGDLEQVTATQRGFISSPSKWAEDVEKPCLLPSVQCLCPDLQLPTVSKWQLGLTSRTASEEALTWPHRRFLLWGRSGAPSENSWSKQSPRTVMATLLTSCQR